MAVVQYLRFSPKLFVTDESIDLISKENMYVRIPKGTLWASLSVDQGENAAILYGDLEYAVDMIYESDIGARGRTFKGNVPCYKIYVGGTHLNVKSSDATLQDLNAHNYSGEEKFLDDTEAYLEKCGKLEFLEGKIMKCKSGEGKIIWSVGGGDGNVLFANEKSTGVIQGKHVHVLGPNSLVSIGDGTVVIQNSKGNDIVIDRTGIRNPKELRDLGKNISEAVGKVMSEFKEEF